MKSFKIKRYSQIIIPIYLNSSTKRQRWWKINPINYVNGAWSWTHTYYNRRLCRLRRRNWPRCVSCIGGEFLLLLRGRNVCYRQRRVFVTAWYLTMSTYDVRRIGQATIAVPANTLQTDTHTHLHTHTHRHTDIHTDTPTNGRTDRQAHRHTGRQDTRLICSVQCLHLCVCLCRSVWVSVLFSSAFYVNSACVSTFVPACIRVSAFVCICHWVFALFDVYITLSTRTPNYLITPYTSARCCDHQVQTGLLAEPRCRTVMGSVAFDVFVHRTETLSSELLYRNIGRIRAYINSLLTLLYNIALLGLYSNL